MNLEGKTALVTGSGRNIGRAIALKLAMQGASVAVNSRRNEVEAREVCEEILAEGGKALPFIADIGIESEVKDYSIVILNTFTKRPASLERAVFISKNHQNMP